MVRSPDFLRVSIREIALATLIHQRRLTPSCGGHAPTAERTVGPARTVAESLTPKPGIREHNRYLRDHQPGRRRVRLLRCCGREMISPGSSLSGRDGIADGGVWVLRRGSQLPPELPPATGPRALSEFGEGARLESRASYGFPARTGIKRLAGRAAAPLRYIAIILRSYSSVGGHYFMPPASYPGCHAPPLPCRSALSQLQD